MFKYFITFLGGFICAFLLFTLFISPSESRAQYIYGHDVGIVAGRLEAVDAIQKEFGIYDGHTPYKFLFGAHTSDVISIETNGIKTVRVIP